MLIRLFSAELQGAWLNNLFWKQHTSAPVDEVEFEHDVCKDSALALVSSYILRLLRTLSSARQREVEDQVSYSWRTSLGKQPTQLQQHCASLVGMFRLSCIDTRWASLYLNFLQEHKVVVSSLLTRLRLITCSEWLSLKNQRRVRIHATATWRFEWVAIGKLKDWHNCAMKRKTWRRINDPTAKWY